jgi:hypothetical protein
VTARRSRKQTRAEATFEAARAIALGLAGVDEGTSYGTPAFRVRKKFFARLHQDGDALVVRTSYDAREVLLRAKPRSFFLTDHYRAYPFVLVRLATVSRADLEDVLTQAWRAAGGRPT